MSVEDFPNKPLSFDRAVEFPQLKDCVYVDHAGTTLYSKSQIEAHQKELLSNLYGNPHSRSQSSRLTTDAIDQIRYRILQFFNTTSQDYSVIFTSGCTASLKLVAESFTFDPDQSCNDDSKSKDNNSDILERHSNSKIMNQVDKDVGFKRTFKQTSECKMKTFQDGCHDCLNNLKVSTGCFAYLLNNHTSVQGMREVLKDKVQSIICIEDLEDDHFKPEDLADDHFKLHFLQQKIKGYQNGNCLFVYPAQSNYCGHKYPLQWINKIHQHQMTFQRSFPGRWFVLLDAACYVSTSHLDLDIHKPDFVTLSFYKMFGFPTGIGALLVRNDSANVLSKTYFGGGTVGVSSPTELFHINRTNLSDRFEDGTVPFLDIIALRHGFDVLENLGGGIKSISHHTFTIAQYFHHCLHGLCHGNSQRVADIYCHGDFSDPLTQGPIVNFNLLRQDGSYIGFAEVDKMAQLYNIHLRTGCFCNIGACQKYLAMSTEQIKENFEAGHVCGDDKDLIDGKPTGSIRVSFGYMSTIDDAEHCLKFICECFVENDHKPDFLSKKYYTNFKSNFVCDKNTKSLISMENSNWTDSNRKFDWSKLKPVISDKIPVVSTHNNTLCDIVTNGEKNIFSGNTKNNINSCFSTVESNLILTDVLSKCSPSNRIVTNICLFPVKSCGAFEVTNWEICETGLRYDREWMIVSESGVTISQKREPQLCLIKPTIDLANQTLVLSYPDMCSIELPLDIDGDSKQSTLPCVGKVCGDRITGIDCGDSVGDWISKVVQKPGCRLIQQNKADSRLCRLKEKADGTENSSKLSLANESQYLLICRESVLELQQKIQHNGDAQEFDFENLIQRFRANIVVGGGQALEEDGWEAISIGNNKFVSQGGCSRCQMVCLDQTTGERSKEPLKTLAAWRGRKIPFGIHIRHDSSTVGSRINVGDVIDME